jgi:hypothetical protein
MCQEVSEYAVHNETDAGVYVQNHRSCDCDVTK